MRTVFLLLLFVYPIQPQISPQQTYTNTFHPFSNAFVFTVEFGGTYPYTDFTIPELDYFGRGSIEYYFPSRSIHSLGIKLLGGGGFMTAEFEGTSRIYPSPAANFRTSIFFVGGGYTYAIKLGNGVPYLSATISYLRFDPRDKEGNFLLNYPPKEYDLNSFMYSGELGIRFPFADVLSLNLGVNINFADTDYLDDVKKGLNNDVFATAFIGISLYVGAEKDKDGDGIEDNHDICPNTPVGAKVDEFGCPIDSDSDGVPNYLDICPNTSKNILVDEKGCPMEKSSKNGAIIFNDNNFIPDTLENVVDSNDDNHMDISQSIIFFTDGLFFCFQIDLYKSKIEADKKVERLILDGHSAFVAESEPFGDNELWYRVIIGYFNSFNEASEYQKHYFK